MKRSAFCIFLIFSMDTFTTSGCPISNFFNGRHNVRDRINKNHNNENKLKSVNMVEFYRQIQNNISDRTVASATKDIRYDPQNEKKEMNREMSLRNRDASFTPMVPEDANFFIPKDFVPEIPEDCLEIGLCDTVPNYPEEYFTWIIETYYLDLVMENNKKLHINTTQQNESQYLCTVTSKENALLKAIASNDGNWYFVLNSNKLPLQTFEYQQCSPNTKNMDCAKDVAAPVYTSSYCNQLYLTQTVIILDEAGILKAKNEVIPSGCYCVLDTVVRVRIPDGGVHHLSLDKHSTL